MIYQKRNDMTTLTQKIASNPYLKITNCSDISDIESAIEDIKKLMAEFGHNKTLSNLWFKFNNKKAKLTK